MNYHVYNGLRIVEVVKFGKIYFQIKGHKNYFVTLKQAENHIDNFVRR